MILGAYLYSNNNFDDILFKFFRFLLPLIYCFLVLIPNGIKEFFMEFLELILINLNA